MPAAPPPLTPSRVQPDLFEVSVGFDYLRVADDIVKNMYGFDVSAFANITSWLALGGEFIADFGSTSESRVFGRAADISEDRLIYVFGPRLTVWQNPDFRVFAEALAGGASAQIEVTTRFSRFSATDSVDGFAAAFGAGAEWRFAPHWSWRIVEANFVPIHAAGEWEDDWRVSTGITYGFGSR